MTTRKGPRPGIPKKYPRQIVLMVSEEVADQAQRQADEQHVRRTEVLRSWIDRGRPDPGLEGVQL